MPRYRCAPVAAVLAAALSLPHTAPAQAPPADDFDTFVAIFVALQENARPLRMGGADARSDEAPERRSSREIIEEHDWTLEQYNRMAQQVTATPALFERFRARVEEVEGGRR